MEVSHTPVDKPTPPDVRARFLSARRQAEVIAGLAISFSMWQCAGHGDAAGLGFVH